MKISKRLLEASSAAIQTDPSLANPISQMARIYALEAEAGIAHSSDPLLEKHHAQYCERDITALNTKIKDLQDKLSGMADHDDERPTLQKQLKAAQGELAIVNQELDEVQGIAPAPNKTVAAKKK